MSRPAWGVGPIRCGKMKCKWRGYETDLVSVPHPNFKSATQAVCPSCGCDSYMHMNEREIAAWKRTQAPAVQEGSESNG